MFDGESIAGRYTATWNAVALGIMYGDDPGIPTIVTRNMVRLIDNTDRGGDMVMGGVYRGVRGRALMRCLEAYKAGVLAAKWPWGADGKVGVIGRDPYDLAQALVLTAMAGTPAATKPASLTASKAVIAPDVDIKDTYGPILREVPLEFLLMPYDASGDTLYTKS
jgi:hypothetical protein